MKLQNTYTLLSRPWCRLVVAILTLPLCSRAQIEVSNAIDFGYPFLINKNNAKLNYTQVSAGMRFGVSYKPTDVQFFPTLYFSFGRTRLPIKQFETEVLGLNINYLNLLLNGNFVFPVGQKGNTIYAIGGIGFTKLNQRGLYIAGKNGGADVAYLDSATYTNKVFPAMEIGLEYVYGGSANNNLYLSMGVNLEYIYFFPERNYYYATVKDTYRNVLAVNGGLTGHAIVPSFSLCLHYLLGKQLIFWHKK